MVQPYRTWIKRRWRRSPNARSNSVAWTLWHMNQVLGTFIHQRFRSLPQLWDHEGWAQKFGVAPDPDDRGVGWTAEQVRAWTPSSRDAQLGYYEAIEASTLSYLKHVSEEEMLRK